MKSYKTSWELYNNMSEEHRKIYNMSEEEKRKRCSNCKYLNTNTFSTVYSNPCSSCIGSIEHSVCVDEDFFDYANFL